MANFETAILSKTCYRGKELTLLQIQYSPSKETSATYSATKFCNYFLQQVIGCYADKLYCLYTGRSRPIPSSPPPPPPPCEISQVYRPLHRIQRGLFSSVFKSISNFFREGIKGVLGRREVNTF